MTKEAVAVPVDPAAENIYSSIDEIENNSEIEYAVIDGLKDGQKFRIGSLNAGDLIEWSEANEGDAKRVAGLRLIVKSLVDKDGKRFATNKDLEKLKRLPHKATERVVREILKLNGMEVGQQEKLKKD